MIGIILIVVLALSAIGFITLLVLGLGWILNQEEKYL